MTFGTNPVYTSIYVVSFPSSAAEKYGSALLEYRVSGNNSRSQDERDKTCLSVTYRSCVFMSAVGRTAV